MAEQSFIVNTVYGPRSGGTAESSKQTSGAEKLQFVRLAWTDPMARACQVGEVPVFLAALSTATTSMLPPPRSIPQCPHLLVVTRGGGMGLPK